MYVPLIYMGAYLHKGEVYATFLYATVYFLDIWNFIPLDLPQPRLVWTNWLINILVRLLS